METYLLVPFFDLQAVPDAVRDSWKKATADVVDSGYFIGGNEVSGFEGEFAEYCGANHCVGVGNGLDALAMALEALGIGPGKRVAVPVHTFIATWLAVLRVGAEPIGIDVNSKGQLDVEALRSVSDGVDAVIPVHMHGATVDMPRLMDWARETNTVVIEDCAQAQGAQVQGRHVGTWGHAGAFSFYPTKNLGAVGDAGAVITDNREIAERVRSLGNYGAAAGDKYKHSSLGWNSRLDPIQAAVLRVNLRLLDSWISEKRRIASIYLSSMQQGHGGLKPLVGTADESVWHHFVVLTDDRESMQVTARTQGIQTDIHYPHLASDEIASLLRSPTVTCPRGTSLALRSVSVPISPWMTDYQVTRVSKFLAGL